MLLLVQSQDANNTCCKCKLSQNSSSNTCNCSNTRYATTAAVTLAELAQLQQTCHITFLQSICCSHIDTADISTSQGTELCSRAHSSIHVYRLQSCNSTGTTKLADDNKPTLTTCIQITCTRTYLCNKQSTSTSCNR